MDESNTEMEALRVQCERLRRDRDDLRKDINARDDKAESLASAQLKLVANELSKDIKNDFYESVKRGLWIVALFGAVATAGGVITLSDLLRSRIDSAVEGKHKEIDKLREGVIGALVEVKVLIEGANREVDALKAEVQTTKKQFIQLKQQVEEEGAKAIASIRGVNISVTSTVDASGQTSKKASATLRASTNVTATLTGSISTAADWFGTLPRGMVGIAGSSFNQVAMETSSSQTPQGEFSFWFQKMLRDPSADRDKNQVVSLVEAVKAAAPKLRSTPVVVGEDQHSSLFSLSSIQEADRPSRKIWAILVGINMYKPHTLDKHKNDVNLRGPINDIKGFSALLSERSHLLATDVSVTQLLDERATLANIRSSIEALENVSSPQDVVVFYFSGHQSNIPGPISKSIVKTLLPHDWEGARFLPVTDVVQWLSKVPAKQRIFIADV